MKIFPLLFAVSFPETAAQSIQWNLYQKNDGHSHHSGKAYSFQDTENSPKEDHDENPVEEKAKTLLKLRILSDFTKYKSINLKFLGRWSFEK